MNREELLKVAKPILFSTEMVRAILDRRKTMTRRVVKPQPPEGYTFVGVCTGSTNDEYVGKFGWGKETGGYVHHARPRYKVGDILYVQETWLNADDGFYYKSNETLYSKSLRDSFGYKWKPSIFMPKSAARIFLKVNGVRVERLQDITGSNCLSEGIHEPYACRSESGYEFEMRTQFKELWNGINAKRGYGWNTNPWVWVYEFEMLEV